MRRGYEPPAARESAGLPRLRRAGTELGGRLRPRADAELAQDRRDVVIDRALGEEQALGDLRVAQAFGEQGDDLQLACGQSRRVLLRRAPRAARQPADSELAQPLYDDRRRRDSAELLQLCERAPQRLFLVRLGERERGLVR